MSKPQTWHTSGTSKIKHIYNIKVSKTGKKYTYYKEERDGVIHKGTKDEAIEEFKKSMINKYEKVDFLRRFLKVLTFFFEFI